MGGSARDPEVYLLVRISWIMSFFSITSHIIFPLSLSLSPWFIDLFTRPKMVIPKDVQHQSVHYELACTRARIYVI